MAQEEIETPYRLPSDPGIKVYSNPDGQVVIRQESVYGDEDEFIYVSPERVDRLIHFIRTVRDEILTNQADAAAGRDDPFGADSEPYIPGKNP